MAKRALIIGSETGGLTGVHNDIHGIRDALKRWGFAEPDVRVGDRASRQGILDGYEALIGSHGPDDVAVIYYSGHGGRALNPLSQDPSSPQYLQFLVPTDFETVKGEFRGLFSFELSTLQQRLTDRGRNVTVILDCCHAAMMSRDLDRLRPRALPRVWTDGVAELLARLSSAVARLAPESNPYAVRLVATEADRSAYETARADGTVSGIMTDALIKTLGEIEPGSDSTNWLSLTARIRELVIRRAPEQRPEVEGPSLRRLFAMAQTGEAGSVVFFRDHGQPSLRAGRVLGAHVGAEYALLRLGATQPVPADVVAKAVVTSVEGNVSRVKVDPPNGKVEDGALAFPTRLPFGKRAVKLEGENAAAVIAESKFVVPAGPGDEAIATLQAKNNVLVVLDKSGAALTDATKDDAAGQKLVGDVLAGLARSDALRLLPSGDLPGKLDIAWGRVEGGERVPMQDGDMLYAGERLYVDVTNRTESTVRMALLDLGIRGDVTLLTTSIPSGVQIAPGGRYTVGERDGKLNGLPLSWNSHVPSDGPRREGLVAIAADSQTDFAALTGSIDRAERHAGPRSSLDELVDQIGCGGTREVGAESGGGGRYIARNVEFQLSPNTRPAPGRRAHFAVDQSLAPAFLSREAPAPSADLGPIAVRLKRLVVHANRALWSTDIRLDALVVTAPSSGETPYQPATFQFPRIGAGDSLPFDDLLVFAGRPVQYLDFSLWVSKAKSDSKPLAELLKDVVTDHEFQAAAVTLIGLAAAAPVATGIVAAGAAAGTIGYFADKVISAATGSSIGLYRTSFLPGQNFGRGTHPSIGMIRAQDFSFVFEILGLDGSKSGATA